MVKRTIMSAAYWPVVLISFLCISCVSRLERPQLSGNILDLDGRPVAECTVGETTTDENGRYVLKEKRYRQFLLTELFHMEAPPAFVQERINKKGFKTKVLRRFFRYGGGSPRGTSWEVDTIYLRALGPPDPEHISKSWDLSVSRDADTLWFINPSKEAACITFDCQIFHMDIPQKNTDENSLPTDLEIGRWQFYAMTLSAPGALQIRTLATNSQERDSLNEKDHEPFTPGSWHLEHDRISLKSDVAILNGTFTITDLEYSYMKWVRVN